MHNIRNLLVGGYSKHQQFDSCYMLVKGANGVKAKLIGYTNCGPKEEGHLGTKDLGN